jgi:hypothetical protein
MDGGDQHDLRSHDDSLNISCRTIDTFAKSSNFDSAYLQITSRAPSSYSHECFEESDDATFGTMTGDHIQSFHFSSDS